MAKIMGIDRLRVGTDGEGIATLVGFYGCPLNCRYCLNPECHQKKAKGLRLNAQQLYEIVKRDEIYFRMSGGGVVFGGGEPLLYSWFIKKFAKIVGGRWKIRVESSLNVGWKQVERLTDVVDEWIIDIKDADPEIYRRYTEKKNQKVIENCRRLSELVSLEKIHIRIPHIPGYNTEDDVKKSVQIFENYGRIEVFHYEIRTNEQN